MTEKLKARHKKASFIFMKGKLVNERFTIKLVVQNHQMLQRLVFYFAVKMVKNSVSCKFIEL
jgi:hypothetical protein